MIPLPPHSPPTSAVSFSSRSSLSQSSVSYNADSGDSQSSAPIRQNGGSNFHSTLENLVNLAEMGHREENYSSDTGHEGEMMDNTERKVKAEAKSNRKVLVL